MATAEGDVLGYSELDDSEFSGFEPDDLPAEKESPPTKSSEKPSKKKRQRQIAGQP